MRISYPIIGAVLLVVLAFGAAYIEISYERENAAVYIYAIAGLISFIGCFFLFVSIREKRLIQNENGQSSLIKAAFESTNLGVGIRNLRDDSLTTNGALQKMLGYSGDELANMRLRDILAPESTLNKDDDRQRLRTGELTKQQNTAPYIRKDGTRVWIINDRSLVLDDAGKPHLVVTFHQDITKSKEAERVVKTHEQQLSGIMENVADGIITISDKGIVESFNPAAEVMFGYKPEAVFGKNINVLIPEPDHSAHDGYIANFLRTGKGKIIGVGPR
jgi:PAS domain S-box-containing protein